ncbi:MAG: dihydroorotate dehydrogenase [Candidatus Thermoplasmatota archaeon]|nr:dihydroorotate dehydrogenase [Candidatus Thermoplasmatota archaeon]
MAPERSDPTLDVEISGIRFPNPLLLASGIADETGLSMAKAVERGAGGVVTKSLSLDLREGHRNPVVVDLQNGMINAMGLPNPGASHYIREIEEYRRHTSGKNPIIASVFGSTIEGYAECARTIAASGVDAIELNGSCPNAEGLGLEFGQDPDVISDLIKAVRSAVSIPVFFKLTPMCNDIVKLASACQDAGADAVVAINTMKSMKIDIRTGRPVLTNRFGGLSGPAIKPVGVRCTYEIASRLDIPVISVGGISNWEDAVEYIMAGASALQIGTAVAWGNLDVFSRIRSGISGFMRAEGYSSLEEMRGIALEVKRWRS